MGQRGWRRRGRGGREDVGEARGGDGGCAHRRGPRRRSASASRSRGCPRSLPPRGARRALASGHGRLERDHPRRRGATDTGRAEPRTEDGRRRPHGDGRGERALQVHNLQAASRVRQAAAALRGELQRAPPLARRPPAHIEVRSAFGKMRRAGARGEGWLAASQRARKRGRRVLWRRIFERRAERARSPRRRCAGGRPETGAPHWSTREAPWSAPTTACGLLLSPPDPSRAQVRSGGLRQLAGTALREHAHPAALAAVEGCHRGEQHRILEAVRESLIDNLLVLPRGSLRLGRGRRGRRRSPSGGCTSRGPRSILPCGWITMPCRDN